jgi:hypothetical protein
MRSLILLAVLAVAAFAVSCPACDEAACNAAVCGPSDPFYCSAGAAKGGCGKTPEAWNNTKVCSACCNTALCKARFHCDHKCTQEQCQSKGRCPIDAQYECNKGASAGGCSANATFWPFQHMCEGCCDVTTCEFKCTPCTADQCKTNPCTEADPFICTSGALKNGCSASASYFGEQSQCDSCCDSSACPTNAPSGSQSGTGVRIN